MVTIEGLVTSDVSDKIETQLFQIAATLGYANDHNKKAVFCSEKYADIWRSYFPNKMNIITVQEYNSHKFNIYVEQNDVIPFIEGNVFLCGLYQDFRYFRYFRYFTKEMMQDFIFSNEDYMYYAYELYNNIKTSFANDNDDSYISLHYHKGYEYEMDYYKSAYEYISSNFENIVIVFTDDIEWCRSNLDFAKKIHYVDELDVNACIKIILSSFAGHHILSPSCESYWGAFLSNSSNKKVVFPKPNDTFLSDSSDSPESPDSSDLSGWIAI